MDIGTLYFIFGVIQSLEEDMKKKEQWKKLMSVRDSLDKFPKAKFE